MKKIIVILMVLLLILSACGSKSKTEEELIMEIKAEIEAENKIKDEIRAEIEAEAAEAKANETLLVANVEDKENETPDKDNETEDKDNDTKSTDEVLTFEEAYEGNNIEGTIDYFNDNRHLFSEDELGSYVTGAISQLEEMYVSINDAVTGGGLPDIPMAELAMQPMYPYFGDDLYECYAFSTNELNINGFRDDYIRDSCIVLRDDPYFTLAVNIWATEGYLDYPYFSIILDETMYAKMKDMIDVSIDLGHGNTLPDWIPNMEFVNIDSVLNNTSVTYPKVLLHDFSETDEFIDKETWKITLYLPVNFVEGDLASDKPDAADEEIILEGALTRFTNETLYSLDEEVYINYPKYHLVIIPEQDSLNAMSLSERTIDITNTGKEYPLKFSILGEVMSLEFTYYENAANDSIKPVILKVDGPFIDEIIMVNAYLPNDRSVVGVTAMYQYMSGIDIVEFGLDDMRGVESRKIIMLEADSYDSEY